MPHLKITGRKTSELLLGGYREAANQYKTFFCVSQGCRICSFVSSEAETWCYIHVYLQTLNSHCSYDYGNYVIMQAAVTWLVLAVRGCLSELEKAALIKSQLNWHRRNRDLETVKSHHPLTFRGVPRPPRLFSLFFSSCTVLFFCSLRHRNSFAGETKAESKQQWIHPLRETDSSNP